MFDSLVWWWKVEAVAYFANTIAAVGQVFSTIGHVVTKKGIALLQQSVTTAREYNARARLAAERAAAEQE